MLAKSLRMYYLEVSGSLVQDTLVVSVENVLGYRIVSLAIGYDCFRRRSVWPKANSQRPPQ